MSVGIIGGADGPTSIFVSYPATLITIGSIVLVGLVIALIAFIKRR